MGHAIVWLSLHGGQDVQYGNIGGSAGGEKFGGAGDADFRGAAGCAEKGAARKSCWQIDQLLSAGFHTGSCHHLMFARHLPN